ncbi:uncharacterized protein ACWYII_002909 [Salvelinus alpinus]
MTSKNSTALMIIITGKQTSVMTVAVEIIVVVLVLILCVSGFMWIRKKGSKSTSDIKDRADDGQGDCSPMYDNISGMAMTPTAAQRADRGEQDDSHYTSVHFSGSNNQEVPLYSTTTSQIISKTIRCLRKAPIIKDTPATSCSHPYSRADGIGA